MIAIRKTKLGKMPRVAVTVSDKTDNKAIRSVYADILEIRVDMFGRTDPAHVKAVIAARKRSGIPLLLTVRSKEEGGLKNISDKTKLDIFKENISSVDAVDIELNSPIFRDIVKLAKRNNKVVIASWHNFRSTPNNKFLKGIVARAKNSGAHIAKIAAKANNIDDVIRLAGFTRENRAKNLIVISMGKVGSISRILFPMLGSLITYTYVEKPSGPGQVPAKELQNHISHLKLSMR